MGNQVGTLKKVGKLIGSLSLNTYFSVALLVVTLTSTTFTSTMIVYALATSQTSTIVTDFL
jgi:hypothetical protein